MKTIVCGFEECYWYDNGLCVNPRVVNAKDCPKYAYAYFF